MYSLRIRDANSNFFVFKIFVEDGCRLEDCRYYDASIQVSSEGFGGEIDCLTSVDREVMKDFCKAFLKLEETREGEAIVQSDRFDELSEFFIKIHSVSALGDMAVSGFLKSVSSGEHMTAMQELKFGFEFDPSLLIEASKEPWIKRLAN